MAIKHIYYAQSIRSEYGFFQTRTEVNIEPRLKLEYLNNKKQHAAHIGQANRNSRNKQWKINRMISRINILRHLVDHFYF